MSVSSDGVTDFVIIILTAMNPINANTQLNGNHKPSHEIKVDGRYFFPQNLLDKTKPKNIALIIRANAAKITVCT